MAKDFIKKPIEPGQQVVFAHMATLLRVGTINRVLPKTVEISYNWKNSVWLKCLRRHDEVVVISGPYRSGGNNDDDYDYSGGVGVEDWL
jgi:hypothetical protein